VALTDGSHPLSSIGRDPMRKFIVVVAMLNGSVYKVPMKPISC
jgi:hypothetical protein